MDLYVVDDQDGWRPSAMVDVFDSLIWTERYNDSGDFTLVVPANSPSLSDLVEDNFLSLSGSNEIMLIDTVSTENGETTITGRSLVDFLKQRIFRDRWQTDKSSASYTGVAGAIAQTVINVAVGSGGAVATGAVLPSNGNLEVITGLSIVTVSDGASNTIAVPYGNLFDAVKMVVDSDSLGFTMYPSGASMVIKIYRGRDLTSFQSTNPVVIFDPAMETLSGVKHLHSKAGYKNVAYAWANGMTAQSSIGIAYAPGASGLKDFKRRTLMVDASDVNTADYTAAALTTVLNQKAKDALANNNYVRMTDGQLVPQQAYSYGVDYTLGDIVELRDDTSVGQSARILEYVRAQDSTGERAYPTLSVIS